MDPRSRLVKKNAANGPRSCARVRFYSGETLVELPFGRRCFADPAHSGVRARFEPVMAVGCRASSWRSISGCWLTCRNPSRGRSRSITSVRTVPRATMSTTALSIPRRPVRPALYPMTPNVSTAPTKRTRMTVSGTRDTPAVTRVVCSSISSLIDSMNRALVSVSGAWRMSSFVCVQRSARIFFDRALFSWS